jgi:hypothetical protein
MSYPTGVLRYAGDWNVSREYSYGMFVVASDSLCYALGVPTNTGTDPTSVDASTTWFLLTNLPPIGGVTSVSGGTAISITGTATEPIVNSTVIPNVVVAQNVTIGQDNIAIITYQPESIPSGSMYVTVTVNYSPTTEAGSILGLTLRQSIDGGFADLIDTCAVVSNGIGYASSATLGGLVTGLTPGVSLTLFLFGQSPLPGGFTINRANMYYLAGLPPTPA